MQCCINQCMYPNTTLEACLMLKLRTVGMGIINASKAQCGRYMYTGIMVFNYGVKITDV